ncbi:3965_t:CDS:2 [Funneliformis mosseae]|uniref:3965_t:CDS:1 n=1 Tax=Funneliformis mosseae TaxID=27381 RepID=A0A9N8WB17_FUNMO|nr:3965_t:CDS:2 [Funneliformis mosseae]
MKKEQMVAFLLRSLVEFDKEKVMNSLRIKRKIEEDTLSQAKFQNKKVENINAPSSYCEIKKYDPDAMCNYRPNGGEDGVMKYLNVLQGVTHETDGAILYSVGGGQCALLILEADNEKERSTQTSLWPCLESLVLFLEKKLQLSLLTFSVYHDYLINNFVMFDILKAGSGF